MELEPKIIEAELIRDHEKNSFRATALKALKLYLQQIKQDKYKIKYLVDFSPANTAKRQREKSGSSDSELTQNIRTEGHLEPLHEGLVPRRTEKVLRQGES